MELHKQRRKRGVVLTSVGLKKLQEARYQAELLENLGDKFTFEELSDRSQLAPFTVAKVLACEEGVDKQTLALFFRAFNLELDKADYGRPQADCEESESAILTKTSCDWGEAIDVSNFYGRSEELAKLEYWILSEHCRLVALLGMGGIGKTALSVKFAEQIQDNFEFVIWRTLRNAPPLKEILSNLIQYFSNGQEINLPENIGNLISRLIDYLRSSRCLLVLDNVESILVSGDCVGRYRQGYEDYGELFKRVGEASHQSCLVLTSREKPKEIAALEGNSLPIRSFPILGLRENEGRELFKSNSFFSGSESDWQNLIIRYAGNPLALKIVSTTIQELFNSNLTEFLAQGATVFGDIRDLLDQHFNRLSNLEKQIMYWLALHREPISLGQLREDIVAPISPAKLLEALESLSRRCLIDKATPTLGEGSGNFFTLQPVVMEYLTEQFIEKVAEEIAQTQAFLFKTHAIIRATAKYYVRETQIRLILKPIIDNLLYLLGDKENIRKQLQQILANLRDKSSQETGYAGGNALNLMIYLPIDLTGLDFSHLTVWQAYLPDVNLHEVNFAHSDLSKSVFAETMDSIMSVAFSPDGKILATGDGNGELRLWQVADGKQLFACKSHADLIKSIAFSSDGKIIATASHDKTVRLWDVHTGKCLHVLEGHTSWVWSVSFIPDSQILASGSIDKTVKLWDINTGNCLKTLQGDSEAILAIAVSLIPLNLRTTKSASNILLPPYQGGREEDLQGGLLATGSVDKTIRLWDIATGNCVKTLQGHTHWVLSLAVSPNGQILASGGEDHTVRLWDIFTGQCIRVLQGHTYRIWSVAISPDGQVIASASADNTVKLWDINTGQCLKTFLGHNSWVWSVAFAPQCYGSNSDSYILASGGLDQNVKLWYTYTGSCIRTLQGRISWVKSVCFSPNHPTQSSLLASGSYDQKVRLWDIETGNCVKTLSGHTNGILGLSFSPDGTILASACYDQTVRLWDIATGNCLQVLAGHTNGAWSVSFTPDGKTLAVGSYCVVKLWDVATGNCLKTLPGHLDSVLSVSFSPNGEIIASGSEDLTVRIWDAKTGECLQILQGHNSWVESVAFSPDGKILASGGSEGMLKIWDVATGNCLQTSQETLTGIWSLDFSPNGQILAVGSTDPTIKLWDVSQEKYVKSLQGHTTGVMSVAFSQLPLISSPYQRGLLASGGRDEIIKIWDIQTGECLKTLKSDRPYQNMNITAIKGLTQATISTLKALGAIDTN
jgi:WD40 repeat protein